MAWEKLSPEAADRRLMERALVKITKAREALRDANKLLERVSFTTYDAQMSVARAADRTKDALDSVSDRLARAVAP